MRLRSRTQVFNQKIVLSIIKSTKLSHQLGIVRFLDDLQINEIEDLMQHCHIEIYPSETLIKQSLTKEASSIYFVVDGRVECVYPNAKKTQIIKHGNYFINNQQCRWTVQPQSILGKLNYETFRETLLNFAAVFRKIQIIERSLPFKSQNRLFTRYLLTFSSTLKVRNGEYLKTNEKVVFFILDGYCDLEFQNREVARVSNSMVGEEILFKQNYEYKIKVRSAYCDVMYIPSRILKIKLSAEILEKIKLSFETKALTREKTIPQKTQRTKEQSSPLDFYLKRPISKCRTVSRQFIKNKYQLMNGSESGYSTSRTMKSTIQHPQQEVTSRQFSKQLNNSPSKSPKTLKRCNTHQNFYSDKQLDIKKNKTYIILVRKDRNKSYFSSNQKRIQSFGDFEENIKKRLGILKRMNKGEIEQQVYNNDEDRDRIQKRQWIKIQKKYNTVNTKKKVISMMTRLKET